MKKLFVYILVLLLTLPAFGQFWENPNQKPGHGLQISNTHHLGTAGGLVGLWLFNEGSGNKVFDLSGNGRTGIAIGATSEITWQSGPNGSIIDFVGDTQAGFQFPAITFTSSDKWTLIVRLQSEDDTEENILLGTYGSVNDYIRFIPNILRFKNTAAEYANFVVTSFIQWHTYAFVAKGDGKLHLYIDGVFHSTITIATSFIIDCIGNGYNNDTYTFDGRVDFVSIYNRALSASEIAFIYRESFCMIEPSWNWMLYGAISVPPVGGGQIIFIN